MLKSPQSQRLKSDEEALRMSTTDWKTEILQRWTEIDLIQFCDTLGISYEEVFLKPLNDSALQQSPFSGLVFSWMPNSVIASGVLHLHPVSKPKTDVIWEEWFIHTDGLHHHVLKNFDFAESTDSWQGEDLDHPVQVCNIQWYLFNDSDLRPIALR